MPTARFKSQIAVLKDKLYVMGGLTFFNLQGNWSSENEEYTSIGYGKPDPTSSLPWSNTTLTQSPSPNSSQTNSVPGNLIWVGVVELVITL